VDEDERNPILYEPASRYLHRPCTTVLVGATTASRRLNEVTHAHTPVYLSGDGRHNGASMTRPDAVHTPAGRLSSNEGERRKPRGLLGGRAASEPEAALRRAVMFEPEGALLFAHPFARATICDKHALAKGSRERRGARALVDDPGFVLFSASTALHCARIGVLAGDLSMAEEELRRAYDALASVGERYLLPPLAALLAEVVSAQGRLDEEEFSRAAEELESSDEVDLQGLWPSPRGKVLAWQERVHEAERRAREALDLIRIRAALSRLTATYSQNSSTDGDRSASHPRARNAGWRAAPRITEKLEEHGEHIVEVFLKAIEAEKLYIDKEGGIHIAPTHAVRLHAAIAAIDQACDRPS
jgi:hypothetical protein